MGKFVNPDNTAFQVALNSEIYVDKTGLIEYTNRVMDTNQALICNSRPRRFGKSITANMLAAYYSRGCDSKQLFEGKNISKTKLYEEHLNKHDVIHLDVQWCCMDAGSAEKKQFLILPKKYYVNLKKSSRCTFFSKKNTLGGALADITQKTGHKFVIIIDEWDVLIRDEAANLKVQEEYIDFLRGLFKGTEPTKLFAFSLFDRYSSNEKRFGLSLP